MKTATPWIAIFVGFSLYGPIGAACGILIWWLLEEYNRKYQK